MKQEITLSQAKLVAGAGLYDHLPGPMFPAPKYRGQTSEEKRRIREQLAGPKELLPGSGDPLPL